MQETEYIMMEPPIDELRAKIGNKFKLTCLVGKRAKELANRYYASEPSDKDPKVVAIAAEEVVRGEIIAQD
ncbi:MAG: DNA-directed RNA polymerase subunit omega [Firmicutes bacterium]|nr:DNA-directed RNA polymerase subunit omega [Bacillota bacterium]